MITGGEKLETVLKRKNIIVEMMVLINKTIKI